MTDAVDQLTTQFIEAVGEMRYQQKRFFANKPGTGTRTAALHASKVAERKVDALLVQLGWSAPDTLL